MELFIISGHFLGILRTSSKVLYFHISFKLLFLCVNRIELYLWLFFLKRFLSLNELINCETLEYYLNTKFFVLLDDFDI